MLQAVVLLTVIAVTAPRAAHAEDALAILIEQAQAGYAHAQTALGRAHLEGNYLGHPVPADRSQALAWLRAAADQGGVPAYVTLARIANGDYGDERDPLRYEFLIREAALLGDPWASSMLINLLNRKGDAGEELIAWHKTRFRKGFVNAAADIGLIYLYGQHVPRDTELAMQWLRRAQEAGSAKAGHDLARMYEISPDIERDLEKALELYVWAAERGNSMAIAALFRLYVRPPEADRRLVELQLLEKFSKSSMDARVYLAEMLLYGYGGSDTDPPRAIAILEEAAQFRHSRALFNLSEHYAQPQNPDRNLAEARRLLIEAVDAGSQHAVIRLANSYANGWLGFEPSGRKALEVLGVSKAHQMTADAAFVAGRIFFFGAQDVEQDVERGLELLDYSAGVQHSKSLGLLGHAYATGDVVEVDPELALHYFERALHTGDDGVANSFAWVLATSSIDSIRNGSRAIEVMEGVVARNGEVPAFLDTLAAAYAEAGDFESAVRYQERALAAVPEGVDDSHFRDQLELFRRGQPQREQ